MKSINEYTSDDRRIIELSARGAYEAHGRFLLGHAPGGYDYTKIAKLIAAEQSACYYANNFRDAVSLPSRFENLRFALSKVKQPGLFLEFGVASGSTVNFIAKHTTAEVHGFDSFKGLPENWSPEFRAGFFAQNLPSVEENVTLHVGLFSESLPRFTAEIEGNVSFLHVDCDLYSSTKTIFDFLHQRIIPGSVIVFDEYINYPNWKKGERKAFKEWVRARGYGYDYISFVPNDQQVAVLIR